jgi:hypothetical protein
MPERPRHSGCAIRAAQSFTVRLASLTAILSFARNLFWRDKLIFGKQSWVSKTWP